MISIPVSTWIAFWAATAAMLAWGMAMWRQRGSGWGWLCLIMVLFCGWFAGVYAGILLGALDSLAVGQLYLRPVISGFLLVSVGVSLVFWRRL